MRFLKKRAILVAAIVLSFVATQLFIGCEGSDADKATKETVNELSGKNVVDKGEKIKQQINTLSEQQVNKVQQDSSQAQEGQEAGVNK